MYIMQKGNVEKRTESEARKEVLLAQGFALIEQTEPPEDEQPKASKTPKVPKVPAGETGEKE